jgi:hypothetical protein
VYRAILPDGEIRCSRYERGEYGVDLETEDGDVVAFVPYANLIALVDESVQDEDDRSTW